MKKLYILMIIAFIVLYSTAFTVKDNSVAIVTNSYNSNYQMCTTGINFAVPFIQQINEVEVNQRSGVFVIPFSISRSNNIGDIKEDTLNYQIKILINWHITMPMAYFEYMQKKSDTGISKVLALNVESIVSIQLKQATDTTTLSQLQNILPDPVFLPVIGAVIDNLSVINITKNAKSSESTPQNNVNPIAKNVTESALNNNVQAIESAYYFAQKIKDQTAAAEINLYRQIENKNPRFYEYFRALELYKTNAKAKSELPPLNQLYK